MGATRGSAVAVATGTVVGITDSTVGAGSITVGDVAVGTTVTVGVLAGVARLEFSGERDKPGGSSSAAASAGGLEDCSSVAEGKSLAEQETTNPARRVASMTSVTPLVLSMLLMMSMCWCCHIGDYSSLVVSQWAHPMGASTHSAIRLLSL